MAQRTLLDARGASRYLCIAAQTLNRWRSQGDGPPFLKVGAAVRYDQRDLDVWLDSRRRVSTVDAGPEAA